MNILVYNVAAENGGGGTVMQEYSRKYVADPENHYYVILSICDIPAAPNLTPIYYPWIKKSHFHRLFFDYFIAPGLVRKYQIDKVISLQNTSFPRIKVEQELLVQNAIPFCEYHFSLWATPSLWVGQQIIGRFCINSIKRADKVIVQTEWMKQRCARKARVSEAKFEVVAPVLPPSTRRYEGALREGKIQFFYPAWPFFYKNHHTLLNAFKRLWDEGIQNFELVFSITGAENKLSADLKQFCEQNGLPVRLKGWLSRAEMDDHYCSSILVFPSFVETIGFPLLEAMQISSPIIAADCGYAKSVLGNYENVEFFAYDDAEALSLILKKAILNGAQSPPCD